MNTNNARHLFVIIVTAIYLVSPGHLKVISEASAGSADKNRSLAKRLAEEGISNGIRGPQIDSSCISSNGVHTGATP